MFLKLVRACSLLLACQTVLAVVIAYLLGFGLNQLFHLGNSVIGGLWCAISGILMIQTLMQESFKMGWSRLWGSLVGGIISAIVATFTGYHIWSLCVCIFLTVVAVKLCRIQSTLRIAGITVVVVMIIGMATPNVPAWQNSLMRVVESAMGITVGISIVWLCLPIRRKFDLIDTDA